MWIGNAREASLKLSLESMFVSNSKVIICNKLQKKYEIVASRGTGSIKTLVIFVVGKKKKVLGIGQILLEGE